MKNFFRSLLLGIGVIGGGVGLAGATGLLPFTGPAGTNPINFPADLADMNSVVNTINTLLNLGNANSAVGSGLNPSGRVYSQLGPTTALATTQGTTIATYTIPYNAFDVPGRSIRVVADFIGAAAFDARSFGCGYATAIATVGVAATDGGKIGFGRCELTITNATTAATAMVTGRIIYSSPQSGTTAITTAAIGVTAGSVALSTTQSIPVYFEVGAPTAAGDVSLENFEVYYDD